LCSFLQPSVTSSLLGPNILISTLFSNILSVLPLEWETKFHTHAKLQVTLLFCNQIKPTNRLCVRYKWITTWYT
jgi:hypothetical protein